MTTNVIADAAQTSSSDTAVLAAPAPAPGVSAPAKQPRRRNPKQAQGSIAPAADRAQVVTEGQGDTAVAAAQLAVLDRVEADGINLRSPEVPAAQRTIAKDAALMTCEGVGLGNKSGGFGPLVRSTLVSMLKLHLGKKTVKREDITAANIEAILTQDQFQVKANKALATHVQSLQADAKEGTLAARTKNAKLAKRWIDTGMHASYLAALRVLKDLGGAAQFGKIQMPLDRALGVAFGRTIGAAELMRELTPAPGSPGAAPAPTPGVAA